MLPSLDAIRQSTAEILAYTMRDIIPNLLFVKGEHTNIGFYYDFVIHQSLDKDIIPVIEERMRLNIRQGLILKPLEMMRENAVELFKYHKQPFQANMASTGNQSIVPIVQIGTFYDLCHPPYEENSSELGAFKIFSITKEKISLPGYRNLEVTRISGTAYHDQSSLKSFIKKLEASKKNDHTKLGQELQLFTIDENPIWFPKGTELRDTLINWWKNEAKNNQFSLVKGDHSKIFSHFSSQNLPLKYAEITENSIPPDKKHTHTLLNTPVYTKDTATIFCAPEQTNAELNYSLQFILKMINILGIGNQWYLVSQGKRDKASELLANGLKENGINYIVDVQQTKSPRIEVRWIDSLDREWPGPTLATNPGPDNVVVITFSIFGSLERCIALLLEKYKGQLPPGLAKGNNGDQETFESK